MADTDGDGLGDRLVSSPNASTATVHYTVPYPFTGFKAPVANPPEVNPVKAGQACRSSSAWAVTAGSAS